jgi:hypothetical protein
MAFENTFCELLPRPMVFEKDMWDWGLLLDQWHFSTFVLRIGIWELVPHDWRKDRPPFDKWHFMTVHRLTKALLGMEGQTTCWQMAFRLSCCDPRWQGIMMHNSISMLLTFKPVFINSGVWFWFPIHSLACLAPILTTPYGSNSMIIQELSSWWLHTKGSVMDDEIDAAAGQAFVVSNCSK